MPTATVVTQSPSLPHGLCTFWGGSTYKNATAVGLDHGAKVFVLCQPGRTRARAADGGATPAFFSSFGAPAASAAEEEEAGAMSPPIARRKVALKDATAHYGVYRLAKGDLHVPLFSLTKQLVRDFLFWHVIHPKKKTIKKTSAVVSWSPCPRAHVSTTSACSYAERA